MNVISHECFESSKDFITSTMAGVEQCFGIGFCKPFCELGEFFRSFMVIKQVETSDNGMNRPRTSRQNVLQTTMGTACKQQAIDI